MRQRNWPTAIITTVSILAATYYFVACSPVQFDSIPTPPVVGVVQQCQGNVCTSHHTDQVTSGSGAADILFVVDNGGSVSDIQATISDKFAHFVQGLAGLDYRIGIATTDVSSNESDTPNNYPRHYGSNPNSVNGDGRFQDGRLIQLSDGSYFVTPQTSNPSGVFAAAIKRDETQVCAQNGYAAAACPSDDPRGIYAANLQIQRNEQHFFRSGVGLNVVIISDDDERNQVNFPNRPEGNYDQPSSLVATANQAFPNNPLRVSAIITKPGDSACYNQRHGRDGNPNLFGFYGVLYSQLVNQTGGYIGSVCDGNYSTVLNSIASSVSGQISGFQPLACTPINNQYTVVYTPRLAQNITTTANWSTKTVTFDQPLPANTTASIEYDCAQ